MPVLSSLVSGKKTNERENKVNETERKRAKETEEKGTTANAYIYLPFCRQIWSCLSIVQMVKCVCLNTLFVQCRFLLRVCNCYVCVRIACNSQIKIKLLCFGFRMMIFICSNDGSFSLLVKFSDVVSILNCT